MGEDIGFRGQLERAKMRGYIRRSNIREWLAILVMIFGGIFLSWWLVGHLYAYYMVSSAIPDPATDLGRVISFLVIMVAGFAMYFLNDQRVQQITW
jgi:hypothetical protein